MKPQLLFLVLGVALVAGYRNELWPLPSYFQQQTSNYTFNPQTFVFKPNGASTILEDAIARYSKFIFPNTVVGPAPVGEVITSLEIIVKDFSTTQIQFDTNEEYELTVLAPVSILTANTVFGALRGLETFSQMVLFDSSLNAYVANGWNIIDAPRFPWRGLLIDTSRHYLTVDTILSIIDSLSFAKFNTLHWHAVDGQSFPIVSETYPLLSEKGAYTQEQIYTHDDIRMIVTYANNRGIRVLPEFDMPAHATSWGFGYPWLIMNCSRYRAKCQPKPFAPRNYGDGCSDDPFDPTNPDTYTLISTFLTEMASLFPDNYLHLGGDELSHRIKCWNVTRINDWMASHGIKEGDYYALQDYFIGKTHPVATKNSKTLVNWQELFNENMTLMEDQIVQVWKDHKTLDEVVKAGFRGTLSFGWYLNQITKSWEQMYTNEPYDGTLTPTEEERILGGEACIWGEEVDSTNAIGEIWPRAAAVAERLWSPASVNNVTLAFPRLHDMRCRMLRRGVPSRPLGPGYCY